MVIKGTETGDENSRDLRVREEIKKSNETHVFGCPYYDRPTRVESPTFGAETRDFVERELFGNRGTSVA